MARQTPPRQGGKKRTKGGKPSDGKGPESSKSLSTGTAAADQGSDSAAPAKKKTSVPQFVREVREETAKVTWPTFKETRITTIMVFIMVVMAAIFFFLVDTVLATLVGFILPG